MIQRLSTLGANGIALINLFHDLAMSSTVRKCRFSLKMYFILSFTPSRVMSFRKNRLPQKRNLFF